MAADKRGHFRHLKRVRLRYRTANERWRSAFTRDISTYGMYITTNSIPTTRSIEIEVMDGNDRILLRGRILRGKKVPPKMTGAITGGIAVRLLDVSDEWCRLCLDLEEKLKDRGGLNNPRFIQVSTEVTDPEE